MKRDTVLLLVLIALCISLLTIFYRMSESNKVLRNCNSSLINNITKKYNDSICNIDPLNKRCPCSRNKDDVDVE